ncbi:thioredoxin TrxC [Stella sp.]|uniref:thioredoxin TrxC n=1 Tax=Stella sp. TaxID=2912054 RepID=UPI0035B0F2C2
MDAVQNVVCPHCAATNRIAAGRDPLAGRCGACKAPLFDGHPVDAGAEMYERQVARSDVPVLVDVWAPWCGPCRTMAPALVEASARLEPKVRIIKLNSEAEPDITRRIGIRAVPTMILFRGGRELGRVSGAMGARQIVDWVGSQLRSA